MKEWEKGGGKREGRRRDVDVDVDVCGVWVDVDGWVGLGGVTLNQ